MREGSPRWPFHGRARQATLLKGSASGFAAAWSELPASACWISPPIESFCRRIEQQVGEGGFALAVGDTGTGKSTALRLLSDRLSNLRDLCVGALSRPQAHLADFYRELGHLFGVPLSPHNRWNSSRTLREKWLAHI